MLNNCVKTTGKSAAKYLQSILSKRLQINRKLLHRDRVKWTEYNKSTKQIPVNRISNDLSNNFYNVLNIIL